MKNFPSSKALFLDRDGTIIKEVPSENPSGADTFGYVTKTDQVELIDGSATAIAEARRIGFKAIIISNQSAIARGWMTEEQLFKINDEMYRQLKKEDEDAVIDDFYFSPYHTDGVIEKYKIESPMRKPGIGMILKAKEKHNIDMESSFLVGDSFSDMKCAENAGIRKILVMTGYGEIALKKCLDEGVKINFIADKLIDAVKFIESREY
jgi:D-glycero-D-manno-heptose 1,7-bisphosphate phosphatase